MFNFTNYSDLDAFYMIDYLFNISLRDGRISRLERPIRLEVSQEILVKNDSPA